MLPDSSDFCFLDVFVPNGFCFDIFNLVTNSLILEEFIQI